MFYTCTRSELGCLSWWLPIKLPCTHYPTPQAHNHVELKQNISISMADVGGSRSSCAVAADDLGSGQQGGSSADPGVALFLPHMYVLPCVSCTGIKLALAHTFTFARVHPACSSSCFTHVCQGGIWMTVFCTHSNGFPGWALYQLRDLDYFLFSGVICTICGIWIMLSGWDMYDLARVHMFPWRDLYGLDLSNMFAWVGSISSAWSAQSIVICSVGSAESRP